MDDATLLEKAIANVDEEDLEDFYRHVRRDAIKNNAMSILSSLHERGVSFITLMPNDATGGGKTSRETLELLLSYEWDINIREESGVDAEPFMWHVAHDTGMVEWCLQHGASLHPRDQEELQDHVITKSQISCRQILEKVAACGTIAAFELLRSRAAPLGWRPLHLAIEAATYSDSGGANDKESGDSDSTERMAMVRHLLDVVGLDVNAPDQPAGSQIPGYNGTPICYIPGSADIDRNTSELTWLLLDRGADPTPALELAKLVGHPTFVKDVAAWEIQRGNDRKCCVQ
jgi:hypothetical protein